MPSKGKFRPGLHQEEVEVRGKTGLFSRLQWVRDKEALKSDPRQMKLPGMESPNKGKNQAKPSKEAYSKEQAKPQDAKDKPAQAPKPKRQWVEALPDLPKHSWENNFTNHPDKGGKPTPERQKLHDEAINKAFSKAPYSLKTRGPNGEKLAIITMGGPASGKTTMLKKNVREDLADHYVWVDADEMKQGLPEYRKATRSGEFVGTGPTARNAAAMAHDESSYMAGRLFAQAVKGGHNVIYDGTGKNAHKYERIIKDLKAKGYRVMLMAADVPFDLAYSRGKAREEETGRSVPDFVFKEAYDKIPKNVLRLARMVDDAHLFDNSNGPREVWKQQAGQEQDVDPEYMRTYRTKYGG